MRAQVLFVAQFPLESFLLFCESVAVEGYNMQVFPVGMYVWRFCDIHFFSSRFGSAGGVVTLCFP